MTMPLEGIRVIDWTMWQFGPISGALLGDLGAEVIKVENPAGGDPSRDLKADVGCPASIYGEAELNYYFDYCNRHKKSITLDLKKEEGREVVYRLVEKSDVFLHNFRQGVPERLGMDYETLSRYNPKLIYAAGSGFGPKGPDSARPAFDYMGLARSGLMCTTGEPGMPPLTVEGGIADQVGAIFITYGVLTALVARNLHGVGQKVDISHLGSMITLLGAIISCGLILGRIWPKHDRADTFNPLWNHYCCQDDKWICFSMIDTQRYWPDFCRTLGMPELEKDPRFADGPSRKENCKELIAILDRVFATKPRDEWMKLLAEGGDFIFTIVNEITEVGDDVQALANEYVVNFDHPDWGPIKTVGLPIALSKTPGSAKARGPRLGEHNEEVLSQICGYSEEEIAALRAKGVI